MTPEEKRAYCKHRGYSDAYADYWVAHPKCEVGDGGNTQPPHHMKTRGAHGVIDTPENLLALCFFHDRLIHNIGDLQLGRQVGGEVQRKINAAKKKA